MSKDEGLDLIGHTYWVRGETRFVLLGRAFTADHEQHPALFIDWTNDEDGPHPVWVESVRSWLRDGIVTVVSVDPRTADE